MRALTGAIIAAGAMIGLGLTALGLGTRYQDIARADGKMIIIRFNDLDTSMMVILVSLLLTLLIGLATAFVGLAYHHERRLREYHLHATGPKSAEL